MMDRGSGRAIVKEWMRWLWQEGINLPTGKGEWTRRRAGCLRKVVSRNNRKAHLTPIGDEPFSQKRALVAKENTSNGQSTIRGASGSLQKDPVARLSSIGQTLKRAEWRMADVYLSQGCAFQEAQSLYENAMAHSVNLPFDSSRALLGLGYTFIGHGEME